ncbi:DNA replication/repair protein RecF [Magnetofaba australis]|uniref:DNA replication and repair protein RecF n=1 Tax=Magnetofaba australis IT-1 TaxID=1434232 RepID=A0A1Y2JZY0_9PROT|nr:DNA replication and repair protein RecF [Magnetofaba australis]OSM00468.1 putative DNA replication and repair protein RecF [Magnetofaba australis IT-1]
MLLERLAIRGFRNIPTATLTFGPGLNLIVGPNGHGKSNLLEAVGLLAMGRSFRRAAPGVMLRRDEPWFRLDGRGQGRGLPQQIVFHGEPKRLAARLNGKPAAAASAMGEALAATVCAPDALRLVQGGPTERRAWLDWTAFGLQRGHAAAARGHQQALSARNRLLKRPGDHAQELDAWEDRLAVLGAQVTRARAEALQALAPHLETIQTRLDLPPTRAQVALQCQLDRAVPQWRGFEVETLAQVYRDLLAQARAGDQRMGATSVGPHRDDLRIGWDGQPMARYGSQGQQKRMALALKLAEAALLAATLGETPLFLLDDPAAELDGDGVARLMGWLAEQGGQLFVAACNAEQIPWPENRPKQTWTVQDGAFAEQAPK